MRITLGNIDQNIAGPTNPTSLDQLITTQGNNKFTVHDVQANEHIGPIPLGSIGFQHSYGIRQTQKGGGARSVTFGFCDAKGTAIGQRGNDQDGMCQVTKAQEGSTPLFWKATFLKPGTYTFAGGAG